MSKSSRTTKAQQVWVPVIGLREMVVFPQTLHPLLIARPFSLAAARRSLEKGDSVLFLPQKDARVEHPEEGDFFEVGTLGFFLQHFLAPDGSIRALVRGSERVRVLRIKRGGNLLLAAIQSFPLEETGSDRERHLVRLVGEYFREYYEESRNLPEDLFAAIEDLRSDPLAFVGSISANLPIPIEEKVKLLSAPSFEDQLNLLVQILLREIDFIRVRTDIEERVREEIRRNQRQFFLQQEIREIQKELGMEEDEFAGIEEKIRAAGMPPEVEEKALSELNKLRRIPPMSPEHTVIRNYLDWLVNLPWSKRSEDNLDLEHARRVLDEDHYGLEEPKNRILEYLAVLKLKGKIRGQVICFVGPPGVGKTSLARSIARALGRKFVRISLGGVRDEAEIRGHRRTYVGALPGRIIQQIRRAGTKNPVFLLDEVDKMGTDFRGDPQAALMEVLDPEINRTFQDHYLEVDFDLSEVLFITTANSLYGIPRPLLDRMEVIPLRGYLEHEKFQIARRHLIPRKLREMGLPEGKVRIDDAALYRMIREYTREAGVRELERVIARVIRKAARRYADTGKGTRITAKRLEEFLGPPRYRQREAQRSLPPGVAYGLAWTEYGGEILKVEVSVMKGKGALELTGSLGEVMKESARAALTYVRAHYRQIGLPQDFYRDVDIHIHVPEGAIPKDGPSAGLAILVALISALTKRQVRGDVAMTGEITLTGEVLPVGGLEEKLLAARRSGIRRVYLPRENERDIRAMKAEITEGLELVFVDSVGRVVSDLFPQSDEHPLLPKEVDYAQWIGM